MMKPMHFSTRNLFCLCGVPQDIFGKMIGFSNLYLLVSPFLNPLFVDLVNFKFGGNFVPMELILLGFGVVALIFPLVNAVYMFKFNKEYMSKVYKKVDREVELDGETNNEVLK